MTLVNVTISECLIRCQGIPQSTRVSTHVMEQWLSFKIPDHPSSNPGQEIHYADRNIFLFSSLASDICRNIRKPTHKRYINCFSFLWFT
jgi:hypothetical protein